MLLQVSGGLGQAFDEDPKRWRMIAEAFTTTGYALEVGTALFPQNFVLLAGELVLVCCSLVFGCVASHVASAYRADVVWTQCKC